jgi:hypothetical protein
VKLNKKSGGWDVSSEGIYDSITYPLAKAVKFLQDRVSGRESKEYSEFVASRRRLHLVFPVLFVTTLIFAVSGVGDSMSVRTVPHVILERHLQAANLQGRFRIDVVNKDYVKDWHSNVVLETVEYIARRLNFEDRDMERYGFRQAESADGQKAH